eukprot:scaffold2512_cov120-Cylindrotheca_fusiformis.AAC.9
MDLHFCGRNSTKKWLLTRCNLSTRDVLCRGCLRQTFVYGCHGEGLGCCTINSDKSPSEMETEDNNRSGNC